MKRKPYSGIEIEFVTFDDGDILTGQIKIVANSYGCTNSGYGFYASDQSNEPVPLGVCWYYDDDIIDIFWISNSGHTENIG